MLIVPDWGCEGRVIFGSIYIHDFPEVYLVSLKHILKIFSNKFSFINCFKS